ncbi:MAG: TolC family protein [Gemmataceae bacterium]|nr:TolC family protein [Gemmataceae bacterium]
MRTPATRSSWALSRVAAGLGLVLAFVAAGRGAGQPPAPAPAPQSGSKDDAANGKDAEDGRPELSLGDCIAVAVERQPALRAVRASQGATLAGLNALNNIGRVGQVLAPDLPYRKEQSLRGVTAAAADVQKLHNEIVHDATRMYYTAVYARQQARYAEDVVAQVEVLRAQAEVLLNSPNPGAMDNQKLGLIKFGLAEARKLRNEARAGERQAFAALREVMAVSEAEFPFRLKDRELPVMAQNVPLAKEMVVEMALCRRPELALAAAGVDVFRLEVFAQDAIRVRRTVPTFASGSDIHARMVPAGSRDPGSDYRPEPILPEMPVQVVGSREDRVARVGWYSQRTEAFFEKTRNLVVLDAEIAFFRFELAAEQVGVGKDQRQTADEQMSLVQKLFADPRAPKEQLAALYAQAARAQAAYVTSVHQYLLTLAALERVTAGGVRPAFPGR